MSEIQDNTNETVAKKYLAGEIELDSLTEDQVSLAAEMVENFSEDDVEEEQEQTQESEISEPIKESNSEEADKIIPFSEHLRLKEEMEEKNRYKQIAEDRERKLKSLKEDPNYLAKFLGKEIETKVDTNKDYLADEYLAQIDTLKNKLEDIEKWKNDRENQETESQTRNKQKEEQLSLFDEIGRLQSEFPQLKTTESFQSIDTKFVQWQQSAIMAGVDVDEYMENAEYRKIFDAKGYKLNVDAKDLEKAIKIYDVHKQYKSEKESGYKTSLSRVFKDKPIYEEMIKSKYGSHQLADDDALAAKIRERSTEPQIMNSGNAPTSTGNLEALIAEMEVISLKTNPNQNDEKRYRELEKMLENLI